eukprot:Em0021g491a
MKWRYFKSKEALIVILWYTVIELSLSTIPYTSISAVWSAVPITLFFLYPVFGMVADVRFGRFKVLTIGTWITWIGAVSVTMCSAISIEFAGRVPLITLLQSVQHTGAGIFQANALQFGIDQLQDASSEQLSSFVYWYIWSQEIASELLEWFKKGTASFIPNQAMLLTVVAFLSFVLCAIPCFLRRWNFIQPKVSNPYSLVLQVLKFAWKHKQPLHRSAFTYWEEQKPSRIELGEDKYGGPFTHEQIEDVKAFFRIVKLLSWLTGFFICRNGVNIIDVQFNSTESQKLTMQGIVTTVVLTSLILHELLIYPCVKARYPGALVRTSIGGVLSLFVIAAVLLYDAAGRVPVVNVVNGQNQYYLSLNHWYNLLTWLCGTLAYLIFTTSLLEFIVAQSPHSMRGMLIGIYYCVAYGLGQAVAWLLYLPFKGQDYTASIHNETMYLALVVAVGIVSVAMFIRAANKYKYREREEIVQPHVFAERYYETSS